MKKFSKIDESVWADIHRRSTGEVIRKEEGKKVSTCLGIDIFIKDATCDYNGWIREILEADPNIMYGVSIELLKYMHLTPDEVSNVIKGVAPYDFIVQENKNMDYSLIADFYTYSDFCDSCGIGPDETNDELSEEDYMSICKGIATKMKEVGDYFTHVPSKNSFTLNKKYSKQYGGDYVLKLIDETDVYYFTNDNENFESDDFLEDICDKFPELEDTDFVGWTFHDGCNIGIPLTLNNLVNFEKYRDYTKEWFKV